MPNAEDRRVKMTKKILKEALIDIMHNKPIHDISIKKICETADVNRSTFYHHYQSPQELYDDIISDIARDLNEIFESNKAKKSTNTVIIADMLTYIEAKRDLFLVVLSDRGNIGIGERLTRIVNEFLGTDNSSEISFYCAQFISAGFANILWLWLNNEKRLPPKRVASLITMIMSHGVSSAMFFSTGFDIMDRN